MVPLFRKKSGQFILLPYIVARGDPSLKDLLSCIDMTEIIGELGCLIFVHVQIYILEVSKLLKAAAPSSTHHTWMLWNWLDCCTGVITKHLCCCESPAVDWSWEEPPEPLHVCWGTQQGLCIVCVMRVLCLSDPLQFFSVQDNSTQGEMAVASHHPWCFRVLPKLCCFPLFGNAAWVTLRPSRGKERHNIRYQFCFPLLGLISAREEGKWCRVNTTNPSSPPPPRATILMKDPQVVGLPILELLLICRLLRSVLLEKTAASEDSFHSMP